MTQQESHALPVRPVPDFSPTQVPLFQTGSSVSSGWCNAWSVITRTHHHRAARAIAANAAIAVMKRVGGRDVSRTLIWLQHRRPKKKLPSTKSAPQRNRRFARQLAASVRIGTAQRGKRFTGAICRCAGVTAARKCALNTARTWTSAFSACFSSALWGKMCKSRAHTSRILAAQYCHSKGCRSTGRCTVPALRCEITAWAVGELKLLKTHGKDRGLACSTTAGPPRSISSGGARRRTRRRHSAAQSKISDPEGPEQAELTRCVLVGPSRFIWHWFLIMLRGSKSRSG